MSPINKTYHINIATISPIRMAAITQPAGLAIVITSGGGGGCFDGVSVVWGGGWGLVISEAGARE